MPDDPRDLRQQAAHFRRLANIRTIGGHEADTHLFALALSLEHHADQLDRRKSPRSSDEPRKSK